MINNVKAVVFDWAGTTVDFGSRAPVLAMMQVFAAAGAPLTEAAVRRYMGYAKRDHVLALLGEADIALAWSRAHGRAWTEAGVDELMKALDPVLAQIASDCSTLIPGAAQVVGWLREQGVGIGSTTGYTRSMMTGIVASAAAQGYQPDAIVCAGDTPQGRPAPFMIWQALATLGVWPTSACIVVDDAPVGVAAGVNAGTWTVGVAASGNGVGLSLDAFDALDASAQAKALASAVEAFIRQRADFVIASVADLPLVLPRIEEWIGQGRQPGAAPTEVLV